MAFVPLSSVFAFCFNFAFVTAVGQGFIILRELAERCVQGARYLLSYAEEKNHGFAILERPESSSLGT